MNTNYRLVIAIVSLIVIVPLISCHKLVEIPPPVNFTASSNVYTNDETVIAVLTGIYLDMSKPKQGGFVGIDGISAVLGISADELEISGFASTRAQRYFNNDLSPIGTGYENWQPLYNYVFRCNAIMEGLVEENAKSITASVRKHLLGEAKFLRAFCYFYLVNIFGDVPLVVSTDYKVNQVLPNSPKTKVYELIVADLKEAMGLLSENFLGPDLLNVSSERVRPTKWAAASLLARVYMFTGQYSSAEEQASLVISNVNKFNLTALNDVFKKNSNEAIWQLQPVAVNYNTEDGKTFIIPSFESSSMAGPSGASPFYLSKEQLMAFETGDRRKILGNWVDTTIYTVTASPLVRDTVYYVNKYKKNLPDLTITGSNAYQNMTEYQMVLRLSEQYLIRSEARARQSNISGAQADLNAVRVRAGLGPTPASSQQALIDAILKERRTELFCEWGDRWFELKRTGTIDNVMNVMTLLKSSGLNQWQPFRQYFPKQQAEMDKMPYVTQTPGY